MDEQELQAIEERRKNADMITIEDAVTTYPMHKMADAYFAEWVGNDVDALIAEVRTLRAKLDAVPVAEVRFWWDPFKDELTNDVIEKAAAKIEMWLKAQAVQP